jgi:hypothetical protein
MGWLLIIVYRCVYQEGTRSDEKERKPSNGMDFRGNWRKIAITATMLIPLIVGVNALITIATH